MANQTTIAIPLPTEQHVAKTIGSDYRSERTLNVLKMFTGTDDLYTSINNMVKAIFAAEGIDAKTREIVIIRAAKAMNCQYALAIGPVLGKNVGLSDAEIIAASGDNPVKGIDPDYVLLCKATDELSTSATLADETLEELLARYGDAMSRKLILMISWFNLVNRFENGCRVPLESSKKIAGMTSPL